MDRRQIGDRILPMVRIAAVDALGGSRAGRTRARVARAVALPLLLAILVLVLAAPASAAAPNYIVISGPGLARPIVLGNWKENLALLIAVANAHKANGITTRGLAHRPRFDLAEFWAWSGRPRPTSARGANQHGQFYPAHGAQPAVIVMTAGGITAPRFAPAAVLEILTRHGVPTRI
jgi:hypothetical protein